MFAVPASEELLPCGHHGDWTSGKHSERNGSFVLDRDLFRSFAMRHRRIQVLRALNRDDQLLT